MKKMKMTFLSAGLGILILTACNQNQSETASDDAGASATPASFGGFDSQVKWGESLVHIGGCNDCHTPKLMGPNGPEDDKSKFLAGHPAGIPGPDFDAKEAAKKGLVVTQTFTAWTGPWGTTFAVNLTSDTTGIGGWKEDQFIKCLKEKKWMGLDNTRPLMPPMSMMPATLMSDDELKAIFAYLKTVPPVMNVAPEAILLPPPAPSK